MQVGTQNGVKNVHAWHWLDDTTLMVLTEDMEWYRLEGVYLKSINFDGLDTTSDDTFVYPTTRYVTASQAASDSPGGTATGP